MIHIYLVENEALRVNIELYFLLFLTYSFAGWFFESVIGLLINKKVTKFINRGFLIGPICPIYGIGVCLVTLFIYKYKDDLATLFILSTVMCGFLEYMTSFTMEKVFNARWWDYHDMKFNINGRICLETLLPFGIGATLILYVINPTLISIYMLIPYTIRTIICSIILVVFIIDLIISFSIIIRFKYQAYEAKDNTEEISNQVKDKAIDLKNDITNKTEDILMTAESSVKRRIRKTVIKGKLLKRNITYKGIDLKNLIFEKRNGVISSVKTNAKHFNKQVELSAVFYADMLKRPIGNQKQRIVNASQKVIENFKKQSVLARRLMDAFPNLQIIYKENKDKIKSKLDSRKK